MIYCNLPVANSFMVNPKIMIVTTFSLFSKIPMYDFIVIDSSTKLCYGTTTALLNANSTFYQIYDLFRITVKIFFYLINLIYHSFKITIKSFLHLINFA